MNQSDDDLEKLKLILKEKERDILLSASIGKDLLEKKTKLEDNIAALQTSLIGANENIEQLSYQLNQKSELINILTSDEDLATPTAEKSIHFELQQKIMTLEEENKTLRVEAHEIVQKTDAMEETERLVVENLSQQLSTQSFEFQSLNQELERYREENRLQHEEIILLKKRLQETELKLYQLTSENDETSSILFITKENQDSLAIELSTLKLQYNETLALLHQAQEQLRNQMKKFLPSVRGSLIPTANPFFTTDSLQSELLDSLDSGIHSDAERSKVSSKNVCDTMKFVQKSGKHKPLLNEMTELEPITMSMASRSQISSVSQPFYSTIYGDPTRIKEIIQDDDIYSVKSEIGIPGCPGAKDLEEALRRLTPEEILHRRAMLSNAPIGSYSYDERTFRTPESIFSADTSSTSRWKLSKKLEIVKPMEGSQTLNVWCRLAKPTLDAVLHDNKRIKVRGERPLDELGVIIHSELADDGEHPRKQFESSSCIYTFTNSTVLHPDDGTSVMFSLPPSQMASRAESRNPTEPPTPRNASRRNSCSFFSVNLASVLNERGIKAVTPSALNSPSGHNFSPTVTPCNSPDEENSPFQSPEHSIKNKNAFMNLEKKALRSVRLLERSEHLENIVAPTCRLSNVSPLALYSSNIYTTRSSPMAQLTSLRNFTEKINSDENLKVLSASRKNSKGKTDLERKMSRIYRHKSRRSSNLGVGHSGQRQDLGTVRPDARKVEEPKMEEKSLVGEFVGSISSIFFGRKGGLL